MTRQPSRFSFYELSLALDDLAEGNWFEWKRNPAVEESSPQLFYAEAREFLTVRYSTSVVWCEDHSYSLDFRVDEAVEAPWLEDLDAQWFFPCHALVMHPDVGEAGSVSGIMTFEGWNDLDDFDESVSSLRGGNPLVAALDSSASPKSGQSSLALVNAARWVLGVDPSESPALEVALATKPKDA